MRVHTMLAAPFSAAITEGRPPAVLVPARAKVQKLAHRVHMCWFGASMSRQATKC